MGYIQEVGSVGTNTGIPKGGASFALPWLRGYGVALSPILTSRGQEKPKEIHINKEGIWIDQL